MRSNWGGEGGELEGEGNAPGGSAWDALVQEVEGDGAETDGNGADAEDYNTFNYWRKDDHAHIIIDE